MGAVNKYADENVFRCFDMCDKSENYKSDSELTEERLFVSLAVLKNMAGLQNVDEDELSKSFTEKFDDSKLSEEFVSEYKDKFKKEQKEEKSRISKNYKAVRRFFYDKKDGNEYGLYKKIYDELGIDLNGDHSKIFGSSDIGNVSYSCPAFHPTLQLVERGVAIHTREFEAQVKSEHAHELIATGAKIIDYQIAKVIGDDERNRRMQADFKEQE